ncbi:MULTISPECIES: SRPBCC family protein [unclassified Kribbella]|uniref:SRPBCC family protein n=1 Tax=unclassified Kribbella TaxID=2644121 RepID=UPI0033D20CA8
MIIVERTVVVDTPVERAYTYLADFETTEEWDPGTVSTQRVDGDGGPGTTYRNVSEFAGRKTELQYVVLRRDEGELLQLRGENKTVVAVDTMTFATQDGRTTVGYRAEFTFKGVARLVEPLFRGRFAKLGDEAEAGLRNALQRL